MALEISATPRQSARRAGLTGAPAPAGAGMMSCNERWGATLVVVRSPRATVEKALVRGHLGPRAFPRLRAPAKDARHVLGRGHAVRQDLGRAATGAAVVRRAPALKMASPEARTAPLGPSWSRRRWRTFRRLRGSTGPTYPACRCACPRGSRRRLWPPTTCPQNAGDAYRRPSLARRGVVIRVHSPGWGGPGVSAPVDPRARRCRRR